MPYIYDAYEIKINLRTDDWNITDIIRTEVSFRDETACLMMTAQSDKENRLPSGKLLSVHTVPQMTFDQDYWDEIDAEYDRWMEDREYNDN